MNKMKNKYQQKNKIFLNKIKNKINNNSKIKSLFKIIATVNNRQILNKNNNKKVYLLQILDQQD
jgi:hypothetical protein